MNKMNTKKEAKRIRMYEEIEIQLWSFKFSEFMTLILRYTSILSVQFVYWLKFLR